MKVILLEKVANLGSVGEQVDVKAGYGRNFLLPYGKAVSATKLNLAEFEARRSELEAAAAAAVSVAKKRLETIVGKQVTISANASDEGKLFGSIGPREIAESMTAMGLEMAKKEIDLPAGPIHELGEYEVSVRLHTDVVGSIKVNVIAAA